MAEQINWSSEQDEILIDFVRTHEALYNVKSAEYRKMQLKPSLWHGIGTILRKADIKPINVDTSYLHEIKTSENEVVTPLIQGQVTGGQNHKHHGNLIQISEYVNDKEHTSLHYGNFESIHETHKEVLDLPHFEKHPLEYDPSKASYDTPGAVDSYGHPATESTLPNLHSNFNGFGIGLKDSDLYQSEEYINQLNEINGLQRRRRMDAYISSTSSTTTKTK